MSMLNDTQAPVVELTDLQPAGGIDAAEVLAGLRQPQKQILPKYFYDEAGSELFEQICEQPEYYPTRTELDIMATHVQEMADDIGPQAALIELGSGSSRKTRLLLDHLRQPAAYLPVDISGDFLLAAASALAADYPHIEVLPVCADFTQPLTLPEPAARPRRHVVYFPGSTIGNFPRAEALALLQTIRSDAGADGGLLIGVDLIKPAAILEPAYNDRAGVTAAFNLNVLTRFNRELGADFNTAAFRHLAVFDEDQGRIEMRLVSEYAQQVSMAGEVISFAAGEYVVTEHSHKYTLTQFAGLAEEAGLKVESVWTDRDRLFSVQYLSCQAA